MTTPEKKLPNGWQWVKLGDVCQVILGQSPPSSTYRYIAEGLPFFQGKADFGPMNPIPTTWCVEPKKIAESGDILISVRAPVGPTNIATERCCIGRGLAALRCDKDIERDFLLAALRLYESEISGLGSGSTFDAITGKQLRDIRIPLPPLAEQQRIVVALEVVERARNAAEEMLEAVKALTENLPRKFLPLGQKLPHSWQWVKLGDVCRVFAGSAAPQGKDYFSNDGPFFFRVSDLSRIAQNIYLSQANDRLSEEALRKLSLTPAKKGTVVFPKSGAAIALNNRGILDVDGYIVSHLMALEPTDATISRWIYYATLKIDMMEFANNSGYPSLRQSTVESISIPLPPLAEQQRIVAELEVVERAREKTEDLLNSLQGLSDALLRRTFSGGVQ